VVFQESRILGAGETLVEQSKTRNEHGSGTQIGQVAGKNVKEMKMYQRYRKTMQSDIKTWKVSY
jgi:hypothetical protein